jgi:hypothetical protein
LQPLLRWNNPPRLPWQLPEQPPPPWQLAATAPVQPPLQPLHERRPKSADSVPPLKAIINTTLYILKILQQKKGSQPTHLSNNTGLEPLSWPQEKAHHVQL